MNTIKAFVYSVPGNLLIGFIILIITSNIDISSLNMGKPSRTVEYGYFVFLVGISIILANRFVRIHNKYEELNIILEHKVDECTQELEKVNQKLIGRNQKIEEELNTARLLQNKLIPQILPEIPGYRFHAVYIPMDQVGGDFYDLKSTDEKLEVFIADVSGHGLPGAFVSMVTKIAFEGISSRQSTSNVLYLINDILLRSTLENNFVSMFYCMLDRNSNISNIAVPVISHQFFLEKVIMKS